MIEFEKTIQHLLILLTFPEPEISIKESDAEIQVTLTLSPEDSGVMIGFHGEKIDALQLLLSLMYNHGQTDFKPVRLDINGYRARRAEGLNELADKAASQALESGREIILPPLSPSERRLVHVHLSTRQDVATYSEGEGRNRRLIIRPQNTQSSE
jgi:spoIIIJ-associated protein